MRGESATRVRARCALGLAEMALWMLPRALDCAISMLAEARGCAGEVPGAALALFSGCAGALMAVRAMDPAAMPGPLRRLLDAAVGAV